MAYLGLARSRKQFPPLVLVGPGSHWAKGGAAGEPQIRSVGYLAKEEIRALMAASLALVLPSLEEGFGLPVAEAMAAGLPVVCSQGSALEEVAGGAAILVNPLETSSIAGGIETVVDEPERREEMRRRGREASERYDWDLAAGATLESYRKALGV
jgi:glycosyltransferase involved in cell wall biosynthesis